MNSSVGQQPLVTIIGSGPAGIALAEALLKKGIGVVLVCGGSQFLNKNLQTLYVESDYNPNKHESLLENRVRGLGGTSERWGGRLVELSAFDFESTNAVLGTKWPITKQELLPYYEESLEFFGIVEKRNHLVSNEKLTPTLIAEILNADFKVISGIPEDSIDLQTPEIWTEIGNLYFNKISFMQKFSNFEVLEDWHLVSINLNEENRSVRSVIISKTDGQIREITTDLFVLACGAIENSRQLLLLKSKYRLTNELKHVGKGYTTHIFIHIPEIPKPSNFFWDFRKIKNGLLRNRFRLNFEEYDSKVNAAGFFAYPPVTHFKFDVYRIFNFFQKYGWRIFTRKELLIRTYKKIKDVKTLRLNQNSGGLHHSQGRQFLHIQIEKLANSESEIALGDLKDEFGNRLPNAVLNFSNGERATYRHICKSIIALYPSHKVELSKLDSQLQNLFDYPNSHAHQIGGTVMGESPIDSVVDSSGLVHGISNLYVIGSSVFPTAGEANPTHSIVAMAFRTADIMSLKLKKS